MSRVVTLSEYQEKNFDEMVMPQKGKILVQSKELKAYGNAQWKCFNAGNGIAYCHHRNSFHEDVQLEGIAQSDYSFLAFNVGSSIHLKTLSHSQEITLDSNVCFSGSVAKGHKSYGIYSKEKEYSKHFIIMENRLFKNFFFDKLTYQALHSLTGHSTDSFLIHYVNRINPQQFCVLNQISSADIFYQGILQELYLESKILELIYSFFPVDISSKNLADNKVLILSSDDIKSLERAKQLLLSDLTNPPSLKMLAHQCALNEFKLKKGFKQLFGTTVYGFLHDYRLESAKDLLLQNEISIQEAANRVGYTSMGYFSKIFREKYGFFPREIKKKRFFV